MENPVGEFQPINPLHLKDRELFVFEHSVNDRVEQLKVLLKIKKTSAGDSTSLIIRAGEDQAAAIRGVLEKDVNGAVCFNAHASHNFTKIIPGMSHIPRLVGATIGEVVTRGYVDKWFSDHVGALSDDAIGLYSGFLSADPRLEVTPPSSATENRYLVTAKPKAK